jgi:hypothetical protein
MENRSMKKQRVEAARDVMDRIENLPTDLQEGVLIHLFSKFIEVQKVSLVDGLIELLSGLQLYFKFALDRSQISQKDCDTSITGIENVKDGLKAFGNKYKVHPIIQSATEAAEFRVEEEGTVIKIRDLMRGISESAQEGLLVQWFFNKAEDRQLSLEWNMLRFLIGLKEYVNHLMDKGILDRTTAMRRGKSIRAMLKSLKCE